MAISIDGGALKDYRRYAAKKQSSRRGAKQALKLHDLSIAIQDEVREKQWGV
jgi:hypothetical protein